MHLTHLSSVHITKNNSENVSVPFEKKENMGKYTCDCGIWKENVLTLFIRFIF